MAESVVPVRTEPVDWSSAICRLHDLRQVVRLDAEPLRYEHDPTVPLPYGRQLVLLYQPTSENSEPGDRTVTILLEDLFGSVIVAWAVVEPEALGRAWDDAKYTAAQAPEPYPKNAPKLYEMGVLAGPAKPVWRRSLP